MPASSANLGPGFDAVGMALDIYLEVRFRAAHELSIRASGRDAEQIPTTEENLIWRTARGISPWQERGQSTVATKRKRVIGRSLGKSPFLPRADMGAGAMEMEIENAIPLGKGLGSSAAAIAAGVVIGAEMAGLGWNRARVLDEVARIEGHPDNASASVLGGIVASAMDADGRVRAVQVELPERFGVAVVVPDYCVPTAEAREVLPAWYSRADAIFNVQRVALLIAAIAKGDGAALATALGDRMHQPYRFNLVPGLEEILALRVPGLIGCALSGAGPGVLVFYERGSERVCERVRAIFLKHGAAAEILRTRVPGCGYVIR